MRCGIVCVLVAEQQLRWVGGKIQWGRCRQHKALKEKEAKSKQQQRGRLRAAGLGQTPQARAAEKLKQAERQHSVNGVRVYLPDEPLAKTAAEQTAQANIRQKRAQRKAPSGAQYCASLSLKYKSLDADGVQRLAGQLVWPWWRSADSADGRMRVRMQAAQDTHMPMRRLEFGLYWSLPCRQEEHLLGCFPPPLLSDRSTWLLSPTTTI